MENIHEKYRLPLQKCIEGSSVKELSETELLAIILGTGTREKDVVDLSSSTLKRFGGLRGIFNSGIREISEQKGIGLKKAIRIHAALEIGRRAITDRPEMKQINSPVKIWQLLLPEIAGRETEEFTVLIINNKNMLIKKKVISIGTISEALVHPREVFRDAIREGGAGIIVTHNHPSGNASPSRQDVETTDRLIEAGKLIGIPLVDHVILTDSSFYSLKENGHIP